MDLGDIAALAVAIILGAVASWANGQEKKRKASEERRAASSRPDAAASYPQPRNNTPPRMTVPPMPRKTTPAPNPEPPAPEVAAVFKNEPKQATGLKPISGDKLRDAIIWGEILQRKF